MFLSFIQQSGWGTDTAKKDEINVFLMVVGQEEHVLFNHSSFLSSPKLFSIPTSLLSFLQELTWLP